MTYWKKQIGRMTNMELELELAILNTEKFRKVKSRIESLQAEIKARKSMGVEF